MLSVVASVLLHFFPGSPFQENSHTPRFLREILEHEYGLMGSPVDRWWQFVSTGFGWHGPSLVQPGRRVGEVLSELAPYSLRLAGGAWILMLLIAGISLFLGAGMERIWQGSLHAMERTARWISTVPLILWAPLWVFVLGWTSPIWVFFLLALRPGLILGVLWLQSYQSLLQSSWLSFQSHLGIRFARGPLQSLLRLLARDSLGQLFNFVLSFLNGSFFLEVLFNRPGWGRMLVVAFSERDYFFVSHFVFATGSLILFLRLLLGRLNNVLDPRELEKRSGFPWA